MFVVFCDQRHKRETQTDHEVRRKDKLSTERRRPRQTRAAVAIHRQKEPATRKMGRDETLLRKPGRSYCH